MRNFSIIVGTVWIEFLRKKDFYVILILTSLFALLALGVRVIGIKTAEEALFLMSFGLTLAYLLSGIFTAMLAARQIPREFEHRTLYPLLARPLSRLTFLMGKITGVSLIGIGTLLLLTTIVYLPIPKSEEQSLATLMQILGIEMLAFIVLATFACALSLYLPTAITTLITLGVFVAGGGVNQGLRSGFQELPPILSAPLSGLLNLVPDFSLFEHIPRFVRGVGPFQGIDILVIAAYAGGVFTIYLAVGMFAISRKQL